jgi:hypothetical protein
VTRAGTWKSSGIGHSKAPRSRRLDQLATYFELCHHSRTCAHAWPLKAPTPSKSRTSLCQGGAGGVVRVSGLAFLHISQRPTCCRSRVFPNLSIGSLMALPLESLGPRMNHNRSVMPVAIGRSRRVKKQVSTNQPETPVSVTIIAVRYRTLRRTEALPLTQFQQRGHRQAVARGYYRSRPPTASARRSSPGSLLLMFSCSGHHSMNARMTILIRIRRV